MVGVSCRCENREVENARLSDLSLDMVWCLCGVFSPKMWPWFWKICCLYKFFGTRLIRSKIVIAKSCFLTVFSGLGTRRNDIEIDLTPNWITWRGCCRSLRKSSRNSIKFLFSDSQWAIWGPRVSFKVINVLHSFLSRYACWFTCIANIFFLFETLWCWLLPWIYFFPCGFKFHKFLNPGNCGVSCILWHLKLID